MVLNPINIQNQVLKNPCKVRTELQLCYSRIFSQLLTVLWLWKCHKPQAFLYELTTLQVEQDELFSMNFSCLLLNPGKIKPAIFLEEGGLRLTYVVCEEPCPFLCYEYATPWSNLASPNSFSMRNFNFLIFPYLLSPYLSGYSCQPSLCLNNPALFHTIKIPVLCTCKEPQGPNSCWRL